MKWQAVQYSAYCHHRLQNKLTKCHHSTQQFPNIMLALWIFRCFALLLNSSALSPLNQPQHLHWVAATAPSPSLLQGSTKDHCGCSTHQSTHWGFPPILHLHLTEHFIPLISLYLLHATEIISTISREPCPHPVHDCLSKFSPHWEKDESGKKKSLGISPSAQLSWKLPHTVTLLAQVHHFQIQIAMVLFRLTLQPSHAATSCALIVSSGQGKHAPGVWLRKVRTSLRRVLSKMY